MHKKSYSQISLFLLIAALLGSSFFITPAKAQEPQTLKNYLAYFYNRYSKHFDQNGYIFKTPGYGVPEFTQPHTAREILSLAVYYKYRAIAGESKARIKIRQAILDAQAEMNSRNYNTQSFSDAWAQMAMVSLLDQVPFLFSSQEQDQIYSHIIERMESGIIAPDSSNRAALSAVYWQHTLNNLYHKNLITPARKKELDQLIYQKIKSVLAHDVDQYGWYQEGTPKRFNPHYHMITALAFASYAELVGDIEFYVKAKQMTKNLRAVSFKNGMVEARIGARPVGLGAQFYLGAALLNKKFGFNDYAAYLNYASGDRFFSDPDYPNRLEYHSTLAGASANYHDDISFSNLAELALLTPSISHFDFNFTDKINVYHKEINDPGVKIKNRGQTIYFNTLKITQNKTGDHTSIHSTYNYQNLAAQVKGVSAINIINTYHQLRLSESAESQKILEFYQELQKYFEGGIVPISNNTFNILASSYIYGGYTAAEITDTIKNGPRAVHPVIPASSWRTSSNYQEFLKYSPDAHI